MYISGNTIGLKLYISIAGWQIGWMESFLLEEALNASLLAFPSMLFPSSLTISLVLNSAFEPGSLHNLSSLFSTWWDNCLSNLIRVCLLIRKLLFHNTLEVHEKSFK